MHCFKPTSPAPLPLQVRPRCTSAPLSGMPVSRSPPQLARDRRPTRGGGSVLGAAADALPPEKSRRASADDVITKSKYQTPADLRRAPRPMTARTPMATQTATTNPAATAPLQQSQQSRSSPGPPRRIGSSSPKKPPARSPKVSKEEPPPEPRDLRELTRLLIEELASRHEAMRRFACELCGGLLLQPTVLQPCRHIICGSCHLTTVGGGFLECPTCLMPIERQVRLPAAPRNAATAADANVSNGSTADGEAGSEVAAPDAAPGTPLPAPGEVAWRGGVVDREHDEALRRRLEALISHKATTSVSEKTLCKNLSWVTMASTLSEDSAPSASLDCLKACAAPTHLRAQREHLASLPWPQELASGWP